MAKAQQQVVKEPNAVVRFYRETVGELKKVVWPTWPEARNLTVIVLFVIIVTAVLLGGADFLFSQLFKWVLSIKL
jgi:preprotein translocase subunit SecE